MMIVIIRHYDYPQFIYSTNCEILIFLIIKIQLTLNHTHETITHQNISSISI